MFRDSVKIFEGKSDEISPSRKLSSFPFAILAKYTHTQNYYFLEERNVWLLLAFSFSFSILFSSSSR